MLLTPKRILKLLPIILLILGTIYMSTVSIKADFIPAPISSLIKSIGIFNISSNDIEKFDFSEKDGSEIYIKNDNGEFLKINIELALTEEEKLLGLMYRDSLCENCGMLFIYEEDSTGGFWMKNCELPLDIIFVDESGVITEIKENFEPCDAERCPAYRPNKKYRYVLEMNGGWSQENNVFPGSSHLSKRSN